MGIFNDNFDSYNDGDLNGQGGWVGSTVFNSDGAVKYAGAKAVRCNVGGGLQISKSGDSIPAGTVSAYFRVPAYGRLMLIIIEGGTFIAAIQLRGSAVSSPSSALGYHSGGQYSIASGLSNNTWYKLECEWAAASNEVRFRINDGTWSSWFSSINPFSYANKLTLDESLYSGSEYEYLDEIVSTGEPAPLGRPGSPLPFLLPLFS